MKRDAHWMIRSRVKTRQLLLLVILAEEGNINRAAERLHTTQPAASKLLKDLEDVLGVSLFDRLPKGMVPTTYGDALIRHARVALSSLDHGFDALETLKSGHLGTVRVGAITTPGITLLPDAVAAVKRTHPALRVEVRIDTSDVLHRSLMQGKVDFIVARLLAEHDKSVVQFQLLADEPAAAIVRPGHPLLGSTGLGLRDLVNRPWIVPPEGTVLRHRFDLMFHAEGLHPPADLIETTAVLFITKMVAECDAICLLAADVATYYDELGLARRLPMGLPCDMDAFGVITRTDLKLSPAAGLLLAAVRQVASARYGAALAVD